MFTVHLNEIVKTIFKTTVIIQSHISELPTNIITSLDYECVNLYNQIISFEGRSQSSSPTVSFHMFEVSIHAVLELGECKNLAHGL